MGRTYRSITLISLPIKSLILKCNCTRASLIAFHNRDRLSFLQFGERVPIRHLEQ